MGYFFSNPRQFSITVKGIPAADPVSATGCAKRNRFPSGATA
jgi:hypothetical protein